MSGALHRGDGMQVTETYPYRMEMQFAIWFEKKPETLYLQLDIFFFVWWEGRSLGRDLISFLLVLQWKLFRYTLLKL